MDHSQEPIHNGDAALREAMGLIGRAYMLVGQVYEERGEDLEPFSADEQKLLSSINEFNRAQDLAVPDPKGVSAHARVHHGVPLEEIDASQDERGRRQRSFAEIERNHKLFTARQWEVLCAYFRDGLSESQIAESLGLKRNSVTKRRLRALALLDAWNRQLMKERIAVASKFITK